MAFLRLASLGTTVPLYVGSQKSHTLLQTQFPQPLEDLEAELVREGRWEGELVNTKRDGTPITVASRWALQRDEHSQPSAILEINNDITNRKQAEAARAQFIREQSARQEAEAANRMKDEFLAILSHELRTPLNSILGWARLLRTKKFDENTTVRALDTIERNASLQAQLIEDILDVSRIIRGKLRLNLRPVNLVSVIESTIDTVRPAAEAKAIQLELTNSADWFPSSSVVVLGDPDRLQQVVWNLLTNGIKFTPKGGKVEVQLEYADSYAQIRVIDTGIGISKDFLPHVFERFRQADATTTRSHGGLGLGLAIVRHLVELHGGTIYVDSEGENQGARFTVELLLEESRRGSEARLGKTVPSTDTLLNGRDPTPVAYGGKTPLPRQSDATPLNAGNPRTGVAPQRGGIGAPSGDGGRPPHAAGSCTALAPLPLTSFQVLVVDDDTDTLDFLTIVLEQHGAKVTSVASVKEALEALKQLQPDVLISDIGMPQEDGYGLISKVRAFEAERGLNIPAIAMTAYTSAEEHLRAISAGFAAHLAKPVQPAELISVVANLISIPKSDVQQP